MPELPEVETIRTDLEKMLAGKTLTKVMVNDSYALTGISPNGLPRRNVKINNFRKLTEGKKVKNFFRRGKYLIMEFADGSSIMFHLRMTGQLVLNGASGKARVALEFSDGRILSFIDHRRFGEMVYSTDWKSEQVIRVLGMEPLSDRFNDAYLKESFSGKSARLHSILLNQSIVSGIGNIYATEALYAARLSPFRPAGNVSGAELRRLVVAVRKVLRKSIVNRGFSMSTYVDALGKKGKSQLFARCYGKEGEPCSGCRKPLARAIVAGRGVVYCTRCQK